MSSWKSSTLGTLCSIEIGRTPSRDNKAFWDELKKTTNIWLSIADLANAENKVVHDSREYLSDKGASICRKVKKGTLLLSFKLTLGRMAFAGIDLYTNEAIAALIPLGEEVSKEYLYFYLLAFNWDKACGGDVKVKGKTLNKTKLREIVIRYPPLPEQQRIVALLDQEFAAIDAAKTNTEINLKNARIVFSQYLQKFDAVRKPLGELVNITTGKLDANAATKDGKYPFFTCSREVFKIDVYAFDCEAILLAGNNAVGDFNVKHYRGKFNAYQRTYVLTVKDERRLLYRYLFYQIENSLLALKAQAVGANTKFLKLGMIKGLEIPLPSIADQTVIVKKLDDLLVTTNKLEQIYSRKLFDLNELKRSLLNKAFYSEL